MKYRICIALLFISCMNSVSAQNSLSHFFELADKNDTVNEIILLKNWESSSPDDPDLYIAWFNFFYQIARKEIVNISTNPKINGYAKVMDPATNKKVGTIYSEITYLPEKVEKAMLYINKGIEKYPARLDMRFGKIFLFGEVKDYSNFTNEILKTIEYSNQINNNWMWKDNKPLVNAENSFLSTIHSYQVQLYNTNDDSLLNNMARISTAVLKYYPNHIESINDLCVVYLIKKDYQKAIEILQIAEKQAPNDCIILGNLAQAFKLTGDKENAKKYLELIIKIGNSQQKDDAKHRLKEISKN